MINRTVVQGAVMEAASAVPVDIVIESRSGIPGMIIQGIQDNAAVELRGIVRTALRSQGYTLPRECVSIEIIPSPGYNRVFSGRFRFAGSLALPIALGILSASGQLDPMYIRDRLFFGSLDSEATSPHPGVLLPLRACVRNWTFRGLFPRRLPAD